MYRTSEGTSCHEQTDAIDEAALLVERLRNKDGLEDEIRIYRMEEISFAFRPYYKVELGMPERQVAAAPPPEVVGAVSSSTATATAAEPVASPPPPVEGSDAAGSDAAAGGTERPAPPSPSDPDGANGRRGLFGR
jgi:hypothetical protein